MERIPRMEDAMGICPNVPETIEYLGEDRVAKRTVLYTTKDGCEQVESWLWTDGRLTITLYAYRFGGWIETRFTPAKAMEVGGALKGAWEGAEKYRVDALASVRRRVGRASQD
jgi:hypothetical protein